MRSQIVILTEKDCNEQLCMYAGNRYLGYPEIYNGITLADAWVFILVERISIVIIIIVIIFLTL